MRQLIEVNPKDIKIEKQVRTEFDQSGMDELTASIKAQGVLQPPLVTKELRLLAGERRVRCSITAGLAKIPVIITDRLLSDTEIRLIQLTENLDRKDLSDHEVYRAVKEIESMNPGWAKKDFARHLHREASMMTRIFAVDDLIPEAREAFLAGAFGFSKAYAISKATPEQQHLLLASVLAGESRDAIEQAGRKQRNTTTETVRVTRCKCPLPSGITIVVSGAAISLDQMIDALHELLKKAKRASDTGWDCKTLERTCRDEAKAK